MKYIDADLLRKEIEKRLKNICDYMNGTGMRYKGPKYFKARGKESAYDALLSTIDSLQQEESEDERIRKELYAVINDLVLPDEQRERFNAWLEKQKEQKLNPSNSVGLEQKPAEWSEEDEIGLEETMWCVNEAVQNAKTESEKQNAKTAENWLKSLSERFNLQPKQEWSKEDEDMINLLIKVLEVNHPYEQFKANEINTIDMRAVSTQELVAWLKSLKPQPKQEWSEEDEAMRDNILRVLSCFFDTSECDSNPSLSTLYPAYQKEMDWLKSLRFKPHWKPSEEQMATLLRAEGVVRVHDTKELAAAIAQLYEQLKKLM